MSSVRDCHNLAMEFTDLGNKKRASRDREGALPYYEQALDFELAAIDGLPEQSGLAWDILHRSAGWLAMDCNRPKQAAQLAEKALANNPHPDIAVELHDVLTAANDRMRAQQGKRGISARFAVEKRGMTINPQRDRMFKLKIMAVKRGKKTKARSRLYLSASPLGSQRLRKVSLANRNA